ncbi:hypothetical protein PP568_24370 [Mycobacteroides abscessus]|uniref:DUF5642 domain-containing protein n=1 Tax=Mycobacteroides abscessus subsp. abscessus TaxID=1185650 RepID=A0AB38CYL5_9MYCO|nr:hypothetical protein [Mycobacteroides abscessus]MBE5418755.1 hypothetical protein [Mycobacteroides abscessus]MBE5456583.1 hypothetical protein [Mycobacteroides abscessus]MBN7326039.1 hypothetical protein [Mycobacteroides abscessus subsp. abscessus]MBN7333324.1 hypothetical protein [Mycobacteroides abscessus subsp. abscessus]MBN7462557.1 hypothetical protein [Mycobacteroides abscessus subsp. abscessus]
MGCTQPVAGTATWPGARIAQSPLTADELPEGTKYDRVVADLGPMTVNSQSQQVVVGGMPSNPQGCADGLSPRLANAGKVGPENTARYIARFNGANIIVSLLRDTIDLANVKDVATRCAKYEVFFDTNSPGTPMTTEPVQGGPVGVLTYKQTMIMPKGTTSRYMAFANVRGVAMVATSFDLRDPSVKATATMPQTFLDIVGKQVDKIERT